MAEDLKIDGLSKGAIRDFVVEFLGALIPGIAFLFALVPAFVVPFTQVAVAWMGPPKLSLPTLSGTLPSSVSSVMFFLAPIFLTFFVFAYITGHLFYRQNPKVADEASFKRISRRKDRKMAGNTIFWRFVPFFGWVIANKRREQNQPKTGAVSENAKSKSTKIRWWRWILPEFGGSKVEPKEKQHAKYEGMVRMNPDGTIPVEFPYHHLKPYLRDRGINYLADRVPWDPEPGDPSRRAKHFANALKLRIQMSSPETVAILSRNEGHIRLSSSMWYVCRALIWVSIVGTALGTLALINTRVHIIDRPFEFNVLFLFPIITGFLSAFTKSGLELALHYQREREILFILEIAHWLFITGRSPKMFFGLGGTEEVNIKQEEADDRRIGTDVRSQPTGI